MNNRQRICFIMGLTILAALMSAGTFAPAAENDTIRDALGGLDGVYIAVDNFDPEIEKDGLSREQVRMDMVRKLRLAGIKVLSREEWLNEKGMPYLYIQTYLRKDKTGKYLYFINVELNQKVRLERKPETELFAPTWSAWCRGRNSITMIRKRIKTQVDLFIRAYLSANIKERRSIKEKISAQ